MGCGQRNGSQPLGLKGIDAEMAVTALKTSFTRQAAAIGVAGVLALTSAAGKADDAPPAAVDQQGAPASELVLAVNSTQAQRWNAIEEARDYGRTGNVGILILRGSDHGGLSGEDMKEFFERAFAKKKVVAQAFYEEAREGGTSITYFLGQDSTPAMGIRAALNDITRMAGHYHGNRIINGRPLEPVSLKQ